MRIILTLVLIHYFTISNAQIIIKGKILNYDGKTTVYYTPTIGGISPALAGSKQMTPYPNGSFKIKYENKGYGTVKLSFKGLSYSFFHTDNTEINLVIDQSKIQIPKFREHVVDSVKQIATISISGDFAEVNKFYNQSLRSSVLTFRVSGSNYSRQIQKADTPNKVIAIIDSLVQIELKQINDLHIRLTPENPGATTNEIKQYLENQVHAYFGSVFLNGMMLKRHEQGRKLMDDPHAPLQKYHVGWEKLVEHYIVDASKNITPSANSFEYTEFILNLAYTLSDYKKYNFFPDNKTNDQLVIERLLKPDLDILDSLSLLNDEVVFAYQLHNLSRFLHTQTFYSPVLLNAVKEIKAKYPNSAHLTHFNPQIDKLKAYLEVSSLKYDKAKIIETNYIHFRDLLDTFKGQHVLIDIWATWCGPCVKEFNYKSILNPYIDEGKIVVLYISIDKPRWKKRWKENMKYNQLEGAHVLANDILIKDMWDYLGGVEGRIPRYALIDNKGNLFLNDAASPSQGKELVAQIESLLLIQ